MSFIFSIFLCFALAFSGAGALPAEPETATTWTVRNVSISDGSDSFALTPELRFTTAIGGEKAGMHFEIGSGDQVLLPMAAEITNDEALFAMSNNGRAYHLSSEAFAELLDLDEDGARVMAAVGDFLTSYGALLGCMYGDAEQSTAYSEAMFATLIDTCGGDLEAAEVEVDGRTLEGQRVEINLTVDSTFKLLDGLRACGVEPMEQVLDSVLALCNLAEDGTTYTDFADLAAEIDAEVDFSMPMTVTFAAEDELAYCLMECDYNMENVVMQVHEEIRCSGEYTDVDMNMVMTGLDANDTTVVYIISAQLEGPLSAPTAIHMTYNIVTTSTVQVTYEAEEDEDDEVSSSAAADSFTDQTVVHMTLDSVTEDGLEDVQLAVNFQEFYNEEKLSSGVFHLTAAERREEDDSVTADVALNVYTEDEEFGISFEVNRAEAVLEDYFDGLEVLEITADEIDTDGEEVSEVMTALQSDAMQMTMDAMRLVSDESVQQAMQKFGGPTSFDEID